MASRPQNSWIPGLNQCFPSFDWFKINRSYPSVEQFFKQPYIPSSWTSSKAFLWTHQKWVAGGAVVLALLFLRLLWRSRPISSTAKDKAPVNQPQLPVVTLRSVFNCARVDFQVPPDLPAPPPLVTLTFCIDTSKSMKDHGRMDAVKRGLSNVLTRAQEVLDQRGGKIGMTIVGFDTKSRVVVPSTTLTPTAKRKSDATEAASIKKQLMGITPNAQTNIMNGLDGAIHQAQSIANANPRASHTFVLLTDGGSNDQFDASQLPSILAKLNSIQPRFYAIGIGKEHNRETLRKITENSGGAFKGEYIDTTTDHNAIESTISRIFEQTVASFQQLELSTSQLTSEMWSVLNTSKVEDRQGVRWNLGGLSEGSALTKTITLYPATFKSPFDLSTLRFTLSFLDPQGRKGMLTLPWNPTSIVDPSVIAEADDQFKILEAQEPKTKKKLS